jgi:acetyl-CoA decarbonylase/synthase complex subunit gamma
MVTIGTGERTLIIGDETVMFRHEEKFRHPCGIGVIIDDSSDDARIRRAAGLVSEMKFERVGQVLMPDLIAVRQTADVGRFASVLREVSKFSAVPLVVMPKDAAALEQALEAVGASRPLVYRATHDNLREFGALCAQYKVPLVVSAPDAASLAELTVHAKTHATADLVLEVDRASMKDRLADVTLMRRSALKKGMRSVGFPVITVVAGDDLHEIAVSAATAIAKYSAIVLLNRFDPSLLLTLLTLRQNMYSDPQKPLQVEPKLYAIGDVSDQSPVLVTTNFSLSYYTVLGEVEASRIPAYIMSVNTEGMSVLTAWAAEKFTPQQVSAAIESSGVKKAVRHNTVILPGYVAMLSGELEEQSGCRVLVGPKEAAQIPGYLKKLRNS